ncbi:MAG: DNA polymerase IV, partial [Burkholderiaceae bacterium]|nr:DNA polymerase IV [Burkholderiaceae bacterium]
AYRDCSRRFKAAVARIAPKIENRGIDEIYVDLSDLPDKSLALGRSIKAAVYEATGLKCSIGIAPNKLLAKIGSDLEKPDGLTILSLADVPERIWPLPARRINGIGPRAAERLAVMGIATIGELAHADEGLLQEHFGTNQAAWLLEAANGIDHRVVVTRSDPKSVSRETTFERDLHVRSDRAELAQTLTSLCQHLAQDLQRQGWAARTIGVKLRYADFSTVTRDQTLAVPVDHAAAIRSAATTCLRRVPLDRRLRLLGVRAGSLQRPDSGTDQAESPQRQLALDDQQD